MAAATAVIFTLDHVSPPVFTFYSFFTTLVATRRRRCLLRSVWVNVMPERLLSVISGILAGGIPGFRIELWLLLSPSYLAPLCGSVFSLFCFFFGGHSHNDTQDVIMHVIPIAVAIPLLCVFCVFCFGCGCVFLFAWLLLFLVCGFSCWDSSLDCVQVHYQYFCGYRQVDSLA